MKTTAKRKSNPRKGDDRRRPVILDEPTSDMADKLMVEDRRSFIGLVDALIRAEWKRRNPEQQAA